jgi:hypothetical protein
MALTITNQTAYVLGAKRLLTSIRRKCILCRKEQASPTTQRMGPVLEALQFQDPAFRKLAMIKSDLRRQSGRLKKTKVKCWIVIYVCSVSSAVKLYIAKDYSTEGFMETWQQHDSDWCRPWIVYSDRGTQLVSAAGGLDPTDEEDELDWAEIGQKTRVKWSFMPSNASGKTVVLRRW